MVTKEMTVQIKDGLNGATVAMFIQEASQFNSSIYLLHKDKNVNAKSIMGMMTLNVAKGEEVSIQAEGEDENAAITRIEKYLCCLS